MAERVAAVGATMGPRSAQLSGRDFGMDYQGVLDHVRATRPPGWVDPQAQGESNSPLVPTRRFGKDAMVFANFTPGYRPDPATAPHIWAAVARGDGAVLDFEAPDHQPLLPIPSGRALVTPNRSKIEGDRHEIWRTIRDLYPAVVDGFFDGVSVDRRDRRKAVQALIASVPEGVDSLLLGLCPDFWEWSQSKDEGA